MQQVEERQYWHICRRISDDQPWMRPGDTMVAGRRPNPFYMRAHGKSLAYTGGNMHILAALLARKDELLAQPENLYRLATAGLRAATIQVRELTLEQVRARAYPDHPSRTSGLWLAETTESLRYWMDKLEFRPGDQRFRLLLVSATGRAHTGNNRWVRNDTMSLDAYMRNAENYWQGAGVGDQRDEVIFSGQVRVEAVCDPGSLRPL